MSALKSNLQALQEDLKKHGVDARIEPTLPERAAFKEAKQALEACDDPKERKALMAQVKACKQEYVLVFHEYFAQIHPTLLYEHGEDKVFWQYDEESGTYVEYVYPVVRGYVLKLLIEEDMKDHAREATVRDIMARYRATYPERGVRYDEFDNDDAWFHAANGWVNLDTLTLEPHTPQRLSRRVSSVVYDKNALCPTYDKFLDEDIQLRKDEIRVLDQFSGLILTRDMRNQKMLTIIGRPGSGKSTLIETWFDILGDMAVQKKLTDIVGDRARFLGADLAGRTLCWFDEVEPKRSEFDNSLGTKITGKTIEVERKGIQGSAAVPNHMKVVLTANSLPYASTQGIYRRLLYLQFNRSFTSEGIVDRSLQDKLAKERPGILNRMLRGLADIRKMGGFTLIEGQEEVIEEYKVSSDPIAEFLDTYFEPVFEWKEGIDTPIPTKDLYEAFKATIGEPRWVQLTPQRFGRMLGYQPLERFQHIKSVRTNSSRLWAGMRLKEGFEWSDDIGGHRAIVEVGARHDTF